MKNKHPLLWVIPLVLLLALIPFIVPSSLSSAGAEETADLPVYTPVVLANPDPGPVPTETATDKNRTVEKVVYGPHADAFTVNEKGQLRGYLDGTLSVRMDERRIQHTRVIFTWVQIADPTQIRSLFASPYPSQSTNYPHRLTERDRSVLALNGDYCTGISEGLVVRNGTEYRRVAAERYDQLIIDLNGDFHILKNPTLDSFEPYNGNILHSFIFGPALVVDGELQELGEQRDYGHNMTFVKKTQRQAICQMGPLSYLIITTEGPDQTKGGGFTMYELAQLAYDMGALQAYNLDGGSSTWLLLKSERVSNSTGRNLRPVTDLIYFVTAEPEPEPTAVPTEEAPAEPAEGAGDAGSGANP